LRRIGEELLLAGIKMAFEHDSTNEKIAFCDLMYDGAKNGGLPVWPLSRIVMGAIN
jgi:hypothetical protein